MNMKFFKNPDTGEVHAFEWPNEKDWVKPALVEMTDDEVCAHTNPPVVPPDDAEIERRRLIAYADPITGSDRHFARASVKFSEGNTDEAALSEAAGRARRAEIQKQHPWNEE